MVGTGITPKKIFGKSSPNSPTRALISWILSLCITLLLKDFSCYDLSVVHVSDGFPKKSLYRGSVW